MSGTSEGSKKGAETRRQRYGADFHSKIGSLSWKDPNRDRKNTTFAKNPALAVEAGRKGGKKTKSEKEEYLTAEELAAIAQVDKDSSE